MFGRCDLPRFIGLTPLLDSPHLRPLVLCFFSKEGMVPIEAGRIHAPLSLISYQVVSTLIVALKGRG